MLHIFKAPFATFMENFNPIWATKAEIKIWIDYKKPVYIAYL